MRAQEIHCGARSGHGGKPAHFLVAQLIWMWMTLLLMIFIVGTIACVKQVLVCRAATSACSWRAKSRAVLRAVTQEEPYFVGALDEVLEQERLFPSKRTRCCHGAPLF
ncbi:MAG: hypothetical protein ACLUI3_14170 [Christensenellales bacterium]